MLAFLGGITHLDVNSAVCDEQPIGRPADLYLIGDNIGLVLYDGESDVL